MNDLSLQTVLEAFSAPLTEEQAWALCYQCTAKLLKDKAGSDRPVCPEEVFNSHSRKVDFDGQQNEQNTLFTAHSILIGLDGTIVSLGDHSTSGK
jgi:Kinase non-catalytic C-lobe domain